MFLKIFRQNLILNAHLNNISNLKLPLIKGLNYKKNIAKIYKDFFDINNIFSINMAI